MNFKDSYSTFKQNYHFQTQNLKFDDIIHTDSASCVKELFDKKLICNHFKQKIKKGQLSFIGKNSDIFFGLYTNTDNCSYKIYLISYDKLNEKKELIIHGKLVKNKITFITTPILIVCMTFNSIAVEVSENSFCLFSVIENNFRNTMARQKHVIKNFVYIGGVLGIGDDPKNEHSDFPLFKTFGIYEKINSIHEDNEYKNKLGLNLTTEDKKIIMTDFDIFEYFLDVKLKTSPEFISPLRENYKTK